MPGLRAERGRAPPARRHRAVPGSTSTTWAGSSGSAHACVVGDHRLPQSRDALGEHAAAAGVELREHVVEEEKRRRGQQLGLGQQQREHGEALLALRAELAQVAVAARDRTSCEMRAEPGRAALDDRASSRASSASTRRRLTVVAELPPRAGRARRRARRIRPPAPISVVAARGDQRRRRARPRCSVHGSSACAAARPSCTRRSAGVPLRERREVLLRQPGPRGPRGGRARGRSTRGAPAGPPFTTASRSGVKTSVDDLASQRLGRRQPGAVQPRLLRLPWREASPRARSATPARVPSTPTRAAACAEADQLRVLPGPRREALRPDVERLEQVRLAGAVRPDDEDDARRRGRGRATRTSGSGGGRRA